MYFTTHQLYNKKQRNKQKLKQKTVKIPYADKSAEKLNHLYIVGGRVELYNLSGKLLANFLRKLNMQLSYNLTIIFLSICPWEKRFMSPQKPVHESL